MKKISRVVITLIILSLISGCSLIGNEDIDEFYYTFRMAEAHPIDHPTTLADIEFAKRVEEETDGRIKIIVYPNKQLGEEKEVIEQVGFGAIDFASEFISNDITISLALETSATGSSGRQYASQYSTPSAGGVGNVCFEFLGTVSGYGVHVTVLAIGRWF